MDEIFEPKTMQGLVKMIPKATTFLIDTFFKDQPAHTGSKVVIDFVRGDKVVAPFVHPRLGGKTMENDGFITREFEAPLLCPQTAIDAERLKPRMAGENPYGGISPEERAVRYVAGDLAKLDASIERRKEWMAAQAIFGGKIPVIGDKLNYEIDFGLTNSEKLTGPNVWSEATSDPTADLLRWKLAVSDAAGRNANIAICDKDTMMAYINHPKVQKSHDTKDYALGTVAPRIERDEVIYFATNRLAGVDLYCYTGKVLDDFTDPTEPKTMPLVPAGSIALLPTVNDFRVEYGAITLRPWGENGFKTFEVDKYAHSYFENNPDRQFIQMLSRPLPAPVEVDSWFVATVLETE